MAPPILRHILCRKCNIVGSKYNRRLGSMLKLDHKTVGGHKNDYAKRKGKNDAPVTVPVPLEILDGKGSRQPE